MKRTLFDTNFNEWSETKSDFDKLVLMKEKLAFEIETKNGIRYGGFVYPIINEYQHQIDGKWKATNDPQSFLFSFKDNQPMKYELKEEKKNESTFYLHHEDDFRLFVFGTLYHYEIWMGKKGEKAFCCQHSESLYDFKGNENALTGISGIEYGENMFDIKRILVIQFK